MFVVRTPEGICGYYNTEEDCYKVICHWISEDWIKDDLKTLQESDSIRIAINAKKYEMAFHILNKYLSYSIQPLQTSVVPDKLKHILAPPKKKRKP